MVCEVGSTVSDLELDHRDAADRARRRVHESVVTRHGCCFPATNKMRKLGSGAEMSMRDVVGRGYCTGESAKTKSKGIRSGVCVVL